MNGAIWVLVLSGILGFRVGLIGFPDWQVAVETAQVAAGIVHYPPDNIFYIYHTKLWTALHQVLAVGLRAGASESTLSHAVSGIQGMLTFQALALVVYALSREVLLAIGAAALVFFTRSAEYGVVYPIFLLGTEHTYGVIGLSTAVLVTGLLGAGWYRTGALLLGVAPCIHPALGSWTGAIVALAVLSDFRRFGRELRPALPWFAAGCAVTLVSLSIQLMLAPDIPSGMARLSADDLATFIRLWDGHRAAVNLWHNGVLLNVAMFVLATGWIVIARRNFSTNSAELPRSSELLLRIGAASSLLALALIPLSWIPPERLPAALLVMMPGRYLNFGAMTFVAVLAGLIASRRDLWSRFLLLFLSAGLLLGDHSMLWEFLEHHHQLRYESPIRPLYVVWLSAAALLTGSLWSARESGASQPLRVSHPLRVSQLLLLGSVVLMTLHQDAGRSGAHFSDRTNDVFFADVASHPGVLLVAGDLHLIQLRTRRPVLLDTGALDTVMYSLETGGSMQRILREVYGLDLFNPPPAAVGAGRIPALSHRDTWESFSKEKWQAIRRDFGVTQVLAYGDWALQLPLASQSRRLLLYDIPDR